MGSYTFRFEVPGEDLVIILHKGDDGTWIVGVESCGQWRRVCEAELFEHAKHVFDAEVAKLENQIRQEIEGR